MNPNQILKIEMCCPYCQHFASVDIGLINTTKKCASCGVDVLISPYPQEKDLMHLSTACTRTKRHFVVIWERINGRYMAKAVVNEGEGTSGPLYKVRDVPANEVEWHSFRCPDCNRTGIDLCDRCQLWICRGERRGDNSSCPSCGPWTRYYDVTNVEAMNSAPAANTAPPRRGTVSRLLSGASSLIRRG